MCDSEPPLKRACHRPPPLWEDEETCDFVLKCSDGSIPVHRCVLCNASSYFRALFLDTSRWKGSGKDSLDVEGSKDVVRPLVVELLYKQSDKIPWRLKKVAKNLSYALSMADFWLLDWVVEAFMKEFKELLSHHNQEALECLEKSHCTDLIMQFVQDQDIPSKHRIYLVYVLEHLNHQDLADEAFQIILSPMKEKGLPIKFVLELMSSEDGERRMREPMIFDKFTELGTELQPFWESPRLFKILYFFLGRWHAE